MRLVPSLRRVYVSRTRTRLGERSVAEDNFTEWEPLTCARLRSSTVLLSRGKRGDERIQEEVGEEQ